MVHNSIISEGNNIYGTVENSVLFSGVTVEAGATVRNSVVMQGCVIERDAVVQYAILDAEVTVENGAVIGEEAEDGTPEIAVLGGGIHVDAGDRIKAGEILNAAEYRKRKAEGGEGK